MAFGATELGIKFTARDDRIWMVATQKLNAHTLKESRAYLAQFAMRVHQARHTISSRINIIYVWHFAMIVIPEYTETTASERNGG